MDEVKYVNCCDGFGRYLEELPNDQNADPGYRHIRIQIITPGGALHGSLRARFCPGCGKEFKIDESTTRETVQKHTASLNCSLVEQNSNLVVRNLALGDTPAPIDWSKPGMIAVRDWLSKGPRPGCRRASFGELNDGGFEIGLFCRVSFKEGRSKLEGHGWRYWREASYEETLAAVVAWIQEQREGVTKTEATPVCGCRTESDNHEAYCQISLFKRGLPWQPLNVHEWAEIEAELVKAECVEAEKLRIKHYNHKFRCTHKNAAGEDVRYACGGGDTFCPVCRQQFD